MSDITINELKKMKSASDLLEKVYALSIEDIPLPIDIRKIVSNIAVVNFSNDSSFDDWDKSGFIKTERDENAFVRSIDIWINPSEVYERQRFTASHEIGHLIHDVIPHIDNPSEDEVIIDKFHRGSARSIKETRANKFAAQLLMPAVLVKKQTNLLIDEIKKEDRKVTLDEVLEKLAARFEVSSPAFEVRLKTLGYIS